MDALESLRRDPERPSGRGNDRDESDADSAPPPSLSIVVPVYNSAVLVPKLVGAVEQVMRDAGIDAELILVNDGSRDDSWSALRSAAQARRWIRAVDLARNFGQHNALLCGIRAARADVVVTLDDDLQNPPAEIPKLLAALVPGVDVVYGRPRRERHGLWRDLASRLTKLALQSAMGVETAREVSTFRAFRTAVRESFAHYRGNFVAIDVLLTWGTTRFASVEVEHHERESGRSNYTFAKLVTHAINLSTSFSVLPLQLASLVGFFFTLFGIVVLAWVVLRFLLEGGSVAGFPFLASIIALFSGSQLFALGIIGEYVARIHIGAMGRPQYAIRESAAPVGNTAGSGAADR